MWNFYDFKDACKDAYELCKKMEAAYVRFDFNGVTVSVGQNFNTEVDVKLLIREELQKGSKYLTLNG